MFLCSNNFLINSKSSLFNALTNSSVPAENYPFCTIDPSEARVEVPDDRMDFLIDTYKPQRITPAHVNNFKKVYICIRIHNSFSFLLVDSG